MDISIPVNMYGVIPPTPNISYDYIKEDDMDKKCMHFNQKI
jgi:hypothetical protein